MSDVFELEQEIQAIHVQIDPRLLADGLWQLLKVFDAGNNNAIKPRQIQ